MNVFDLPGPQFLQFYLSFGGLVFALAWVLLWFGSAGHGGHPALLGDPYQIAFLRGGPYEATRIGVVSLVDRGLLEVNSGKLASTGSVEPRDLHPIEREILGTCSRVPQEASRVLARDNPRAVAGDLGNTLARMGLAPTREAQRGRALLATAAALLVVCLGLIKLGLAVERGRLNIAFLIIAIIGAIGFFVWLGRPRWRTREGSRMLADLRRLLAGRRLARSRKKTTNEALLLASVFGAEGLAAFTALQAAYAGTKPQNTVSGSNCGSSSCGSSCGGGGSGCGGCGSS